ncbi:hypothetical protein C809_01676 [Lachnospiraceae bacterium MD335]|nr:hypothetical protein C809_01676 [Lachnospiraceae bacterium MD335]
MREKEHEKYNALTKRLLEEGFSAEHHPDYVRVDVPMWQEKSLDNYDGGFTYERWWIFERTFKTPCGLQCKGLQCHSNMSYMGIEWTFENDMATIHCPYEKRECKLKHEYLQGHGVLRYDCEVHMTDEEYCYEGSVEHILKLHDDEIRRQEVSFGLQKKGRVCREHMRFNRDTLEWEMNYDPYDCGRNRCAGMCPVLGHELDKKRGNVFYDVKISYLRNDLNGTLFEGQVDTRIIKGKKLFDHPVSMDICKICARLCQDRIKERVRNHYFTELFFSEYHGRSFSFEIQNVRAERRESRDLMQDLEDIRNGIQIVHASDMEKRNSEEKRERRRQSRAAAVRRLEKKLLENGYESLEEYSTDRRHADKWLGPERIAELEQMHLLKEKEKKEQPVQLSLFDMEAL